MTSDSSPLQALEPLVGEWSMTVDFGEGPVSDNGARVTFEWMPGEQFLIQRWSVPVPEAPDGIAIIGADPERGGQYLQHYFDTRGVARVYRLRFGDGALELRRDRPDFSPLDFSQRYIGTLSDDGRTISGAWELSHDGEAWEHDFDLAYHRLE